MIKMDPDQIKIFGIPWYRKKDWKKLRRVFQDAHLLDDRWDEWLEKAERIFQERKRSGAFVVKVYIDPTDFPEWCAQRGLDIDARARMDFAGEIAMREYRNRD